MLSSQKAHIIGMGGFGKVRVYYSQQFQRKVIEKTVGPNFLRVKDGNRIRLSTLIRDFQKNQFYLAKESVFMILMKAAKLDCCVQILGFCGNPFRIIMEYCEGGDLRKLLDSYRLSLIDKLDLIVQILSAVSKIHKIGVIHGDLKCANIFLVNKYIPGGNIKLKIGDFGLSEPGGKLVRGGHLDFVHQKYLCLVVHFRLIFIL